MSDVTIVESVVEVTVNGSTEVIELGVQGPQGAVGPQGVQGAQGPQGIPGAASGSYRHVQAVPATVWTVDHNLSGRLNVTVVDSTGREVMGEVRYLNDNQIELTFTAAFSGEAYVS